MTWALAARPLAVRAARAFGMVIGVGGAFLLTRALETMLYEVSPTDPAVLAGACAGVLVVALLASLVPAVASVRSSVAKNGMRISGITTRRGSRGWTAD